jgi:hypothetical protein
MLGKENGNNGRRVFSWNDPDQQTDSRTGKENKLLKLLSKGIRRQIKRRIVKKEISLGEKKRL